MTRCVAFLATLVLLLGSPIAQAQVTEVTTDDLLDLVGETYTAQVFQSPDAYDPSSNADLQTLIDATGANETYDLTGFDFELVGEGTIRYRTMAEAQSAGWPGTDDSHLQQAAYAFAMVLSDASGNPVGTVYSYHDIDSEGSHSYGGEFVNPSGSLTGTYDPPRHDYATPLQYEPTPTEWEDEEHSLEGEVEGYGTLVTPQGTIEVVRVKRVLPVFGTMTTTTYEFLSPDQGFTVASVEGQGDGTFEVAYVVPSDDYVEVEVADGQTGTVLGEHGASVELTSGSSSSGTIGLGTYDSKPFNDSFSGSASSGDGTSVAPNTLWRDRYYAVQNDGLADFSAEVCVDVSSVPGVGDESKLVLLTRDIASADWEPLDTSLDGSVICATVDSFSQFAVGGSTEHGNTLPVELTTFAAAQDGDAVQLIWTTASEADNAGFRVQRANGSAGAWKTLAFVSGEGTTSEPRQYRFADRELPAAADRLVYRLEQVDTDGTTHYSPEVEVQLAAPEQLELLGNHPNPFAETTTIRYTLPSAGPARIAVYDMLGRQVKVLVDERQTAGQKAIAFDAGGLASGAYLLRLETQGQTRTHRLTVVR